MKKILLLIITLTVFFCMQSLAQRKTKVTEDGRVSNNSTFKGKRALRKEMRIHKASMNVTAENVKKANKKRAKGALPKSGKKPGKPQKEKDNKNKPNVADEKRLAAIEPVKE